jgi:hypothetical protein
MAPAAEGGRPRRGCTHRTPGPPPMGADHGEICRSADWWMRLARPAGLAAQPAARAVWLAGRCAPGCGVATLRAAIGEGPGLFISEATVKTHLLHIYAKLNVGDRAAAVAEAFNRGLLTPGTPERP